MNIQKLNPAQFDQLAGFDSILLMKPIGSKLYRINSIPDRFKKSSFHKEIVEVLNTLCTIRRAGTWFFKDDPELIDDIVHTFFHMNIELYQIEPETMGRNKYGYPIEEILN